MRVLFWILLLGNVILFAVMRWGDALLTGDHAVLAQAPLHQEKISIQRAPQAKPELPKPAPVPVPAILLPAPASAPIEVPVITEAVPVAMCLEWSDFSGTDLERARTALSALQLGERLGERQIEYSIGYWVYMPPMKDKAAVNRKIGQLKARGVNEYFVVSEPGKWLNAISLGVFKTPEAAQHFLDDLQRNNDIRTARVGERASKFKATVFVLRGVDAQTSADMAEIQKDFAGSELKEVPCALTK